VATDDHDKPDGTAEGARDDMSAGSAPLHADTSRTPDGAGAAGVAFRAAGAPAPAEPGGSGGPGDTGRQAGGGAAAAEPVPGGKDLDDFEPYLPPGPNPFSSVYPQGAAPYRPSASRAYPEQHDQESWPRESGPGSQDQGGNGHAEQQHGDDAGPEADSAQPGPWSGLSWQGTPGQSHMGAPEASPAEPYGHARHAADRAPSESGLAGTGYPPASPYPPFPGGQQAGGHPGQGAYGGVSPYPAYQPYGPEEQADEDALADYGLPSPQAYGYAPPPPPVEPLPDLGVPEHGYRDETLHDNEAWQPSTPDYGRVWPAAGEYQGDQAPSGHQRATAAGAGFPGTGMSGSGAPGAAPAHGTQPGSPPPLSTPPGSTQAAGVQRGPMQSGPAQSGPAQPGPMQSGSLQSHSVPPGSAQPGAAQPGSAPYSSAQAGVTAADTAQAAPGMGQRGDQLPPLPPAEADAGQVPETAESLTSEALLHGKRAAPGSGWRRTIFKATGGLVRVGESASEQRRRELIWRVRTPVAGGHHRVAVMSLKGGVGKTTTTVGLGATLATLRGDRVIAVDANPDRGTLSDKVRLETSATVRDLLNERQQVQRYADVRAFTSQAPSRLEVLASDRDPAVSVAFSQEDYFDVARVLEHYYSICITDCGTGLLHSAMAGVLRLADQIVLVSSPSVDGARSASATLDWLDAHHYDDLVRNAVVVVSVVRPRSKSTVDLDRLEQHFAARCRAVIRIPYDTHLEEGAEVELEQLSPTTTEAYLRLAATVGDGFAWPRRAARRSA
jgi:MinD-like ATPase involved in chromosome partitioning or flagellar assembly